jgi:hypothetical protein
VCWWLPFFLFRRRRRHFPIFFQKVSGGFKI